MVKWVGRALPNIIEAVSVVVVSLYVTSDMCWSGVCLFQNFGIWKCVPWVHGCLSSVLKTLEVSLISYFNDTLSYRVP